MKERVWDTLHDGSIDSITEVSPGTVDVVVHIEYIAAELPGKGEVVVVRLHGCTCVAFEPYEGEATIHVSHLASHLEVLGAEVRDGAVRVHCAATPHGPQSSASAAAWCFDTKACLCQRGMGRRFLKPNWRQLRIEAAAARRSRFPRV